MKIKEIIKSIEHIPKCPKSGESNLYYLIKQKENGKDKNNKA